MAFCFIGRCHIDNSELRSKSLEALLVIGTYRWHFAEFLGRDVLKTVRSLSCHSLRRSSAGLAGIGRRLGSPVRVKVKVERRSWEGRAQVGY